MSAVQLPDGAVHLPLPNEIERFKMLETTGPIRSITYSVLFHNHDPHLGTAVLLRQGHRLFAFTAAHNIKKDTSIHLRLSPGTERTRFDILDTYTHPNYAPDPITETSKYDLAILELENVPAVQAGEVSQLHTGGAQRLAKGEPKPQGDPFVWLVGFPTELAHASGDGIAVFQTAFATQAIDVTSDELSLRYPTTAYQIPISGATAREGSLTSNPRGYSGCGVWMAFKPNDAVFNPDRHLKMVGMQSHWNKDTRILRCVPSKVMADALKEWKPELG